MSTPDATLRRLVRLTAVGDTRAFAALYRLLAPMVEAVARAGLADPVQARRVVEAVFVEIYYRAGSYRPACGDVTEWVMSIIDRRADERNRIVAAAGDDGTDGGTDDTEAPGAVSRAIASIYDHHTERELAALLARSGRRVSYRRPAAGAAVAFPRGTGLMG